MSMAQTKKRFDAIRGGRYIGSEFQAGELQWDFFIAAAEACDDFRLAFGGGMTLRAYCNI